MTPVIHNINENNIMIYFSEKIDTGLTAVIASVTKTINEWPEPFVIDLTPSYTSLLVTYNPLLINAAILTKKLRFAIDQKHDLPGPEKIRLINIPVYYSPQSGLDLKDTAFMIGVSTNELISLHSTPQYTVFALGFLPGYAFMGIVEEPLVLPRLSTPRLNVPAGSVAIAEKQTAVYPTQTPGGWRLLGRSPMQLFDPSQNPPVPYRIGDKIKFSPICKDEYLNLGGEL